MGWVHGGGTAVGMLAEMLAAGLNANLGGRDHMPIEVERQIVEWMRQLFGFPDSASGIFVTGTSMANLMAVLVARTRALGTPVRQRGIGNDGALLTAYTSAAAHGCIARRWTSPASAPTRCARSVSIADHRIDVAALRAQIAADRAAGFKPFLVVGIGRHGRYRRDRRSQRSRRPVPRRETSGFMSMAPSARSAILSPELAPLLAGIERADSIALRFPQMGPGAL